MLHIRSVALAAAVFGHAFVAVDASGCFPAYVPGSSYSVGDSVSATKTIIDTKTESCTAGSAGCVNGWETTTTTTSETHNYECAAEATWCGSSAYDPTGIHSGSAWTKEATQCTGTATPATAPIPDEWDGGGCPKPYATGTDYDEDDVVSVVETGYSMVYQCKAAPNNLFCGMNGYEPGSSNYWEQAWQSKGSCTGTQQPTTSPIYVAIPDAGGCPGAFDGGADYEAGDEVAKDGLVYQCKPFRSGHCSQTGYEPGTSIGSGAQIVEFWKEAWTMTGHCDGTIAPTASPDFVTLADVGGCPEGWEARSAGQAYEEGDRVASDQGLVYECKSWPQMAHCGQAGYQPGGTAGHPDAWEDAWTLVGHCDGSIGPTSSPSFDVLGGVGGCPEEWTSGGNIKYDEGDMVSVTVSTTPLRKMAYTCKAWPLSGNCGQYSPTQFGGDQGWTLAGSCDGSIGPTSSPSFDVLSSVGGCPEEWTSGGNTKYEEGDMVGVTVSTTPIRRVAYRCNAWPFSGNCGQYSPTQYGGDQGWTLAGSCDGSTGPTSSPSFDVLALDPDGCPEEWTPSRVDYEGGDLVALTVSGAPARTILYKCREWPNAGYCNQKGFEPSGEYGGMAWILMGACDGTMAPTAAPQGYAGTCEYDRCRIVETVMHFCVPGSAGCSCASGQSPSEDCEKDVMEEVCDAADVVAWSDGVVYMTGDVVRVGTKRFKCRESPFHFWCRSEAYKPEMEFNSIWNEAWVEDGVCA